MSSAESPSKRTKANIPAKLTYFHGWGLAEQVRWVMAAGGVPFENVCLSTHKEFTDLRDEGKLLFGQLPLLEIDGLQLVQSQAMVRYVAAKAGLAGESPTEVAFVDMVAEGVRDARGKVVGYPFAQDLDAHLASLPAVIEKYFPRFESILAASKTGKVLASGDLTYADILMAECASGYETMSPGCVDAFPLLSKLTKEVFALPSVAAYLASPNRFPFPQGADGATYKDNVNAVLGR
eukprot:CAMPEP_0171760510 /NCGR_PEP_ID=MMETSP0991-20121206/47512_1 /TAXON_ID=483369 /ORGANISM="non described non described, Strain CCMP2098" /LENGTH=235 /DNA_ID=CAMNT_0012363613 /DNA_START=14 /DNA_END=721 /DNA_ORIENTATION=+